MATTSLWAVKDNLRRVLEYASDEEKTTTSDDLRNVLDYASNNFKTNELVTGINCSPQSVYEQMIATKQTANKVDGVQAFHGYQSFPTNEVDAITCHKIGIELAKRMWGDEFQVLVCTHTNTDHPHNHFVVNSVSWRTRKKFDNSHEDYRRFLKLSDDICREYGLSVIENPINAKMNYKEFKAMIDGKPYIRGLVKEDVEIAINNARTMTQFYSNLKAMGYQIPNSNRKYLTVITPQGHRVRLDKIKPVGSYSKDAINERILENETIKWESIHNESFSRYAIKSASDYNKKHKYHGLKALYIKYQFMLGILPKNASARSVHFSLKEDLLYMDKIMAESEFLGKHEFTTLEELSSFIDENKSQLANLESYRKSAYSKKDRCRNQEMKDMLIEDIESYNTEIKQLRKDIELCNHIIERSSGIEEKLETIEKEENDERIRRDSRSNGKNDSSRN